MQRAGAQADEAGREPIAAIGADHPARAGLVPGQLRDLGVEQGVLIQPELPPDALALLQDLRRVSVLLARHVPGFFQQRHVDHGGGVALGARIAVPVPGAPEVAALLDDAHVPHPRLHQPCAGDQPGETTAHEGEGHMVGLRLALFERGVGIVQIVGEPPRDLEILVVAVRPQALVPFGDVLGQQGLLVDRGTFGGGLDLKRHDQSPINADSRYFSNL
jgi:hypothetical protein